LAPQLINEKLETLRRCLARVKDNLPADAEALATDIDAQDIVTLNLTRAVQVTVDIAAHILARCDSPAPTTMGEAFDGLYDSGVITAQIRDRLKRTVGFRNIAVHSYQNIDWVIVYAICSKHLGDFEDFARAVVRAID